MSGKEDQSSFRLWCRKELSKYLYQTLTDEVLDYLMTIDTEDNMREYLVGLLGESNQTLLFIKEFIRHWKLIQPQTTPTGGGAPPEGHDGDMQELQRPSPEKMVLFSKETKETKVEPPPGLQKTKTQSTAAKVQSAQPRSKQTYVPLMSVEGQSRVATHLPGRHPCQCLAQKHSLISNCVECGRVVCSQEGSGPCLFCGAVVCSKQQEEWLSKDSKKGRRFREQFMKQHNLESIGRPLDHIQAVQSEGLLKAQHHKDKLLEFDQTSASRTRVIDDQSDYFSVDANRWLSKGEKEALQRKDSALREEKYGSRRGKAVVTLDLAGRQVRDEGQTIDLYSAKQAKDALNSSGKKQKARPDQDDVILTHAGALYNTDIPADRPQFVDSGRAQETRTASAERRKAVSKPERGVGVASSRLQDKGLQEMRDDGVCLSMHQPWASLLVLGIKRVEGRSWYSSHRGRLWIAAASKEPSARDIDEVQQLYVALHGDKQGSLYFPSDYPTSCLLGCVNVVDCLSQDDYKENYPGNAGESGSDFVFIVDNPQELTIKFPIKGGHKIWKLPKDVHQAAKKGLKTVHQTV